MSEDYDTYSEMEELYSDNCKLVTVFLKDYTDNWDMIEDFASTIWVKVFERREDFLGMSKLYIKNYLRVMAKNLVINDLKKRTREQKALTEAFELQKQRETADSPLERLFSSDLAKQLISASEVLSVEEKQLIVLKFREEKTAREIGADLGISPGNVRIRQCRALKKLRKEMGQFKPAPYINI